MRFSDNLALPCPSPEDFAAHPLYLQRLAETVEAKLVEQEALRDVAENPQTVLWRNSSVEGPIPSGSSITSMALFTADQVFRNFVLTPNFYSIGNFFGAIRFSGIWHIGYSVNMVEVGAITDNSFREMQFRVVKEVAGVDVLVANLDRRVQAENVSGGSLFGNEATFEVDSEPERYKVVINMSHGNVASDVQIPIGGWNVFLTRLGSSELIEVT